jgi:hypothetical protein
MNNNKQTAMTNAEIQHAYESEAGNIQKFSGKMSELCKYVWAGSMATLFALLTSAPDTPAAAFFSANRTLIALAALAGSAAFLLDYLQNAAAYKHFNKITHWIEGRATFTREAYNTQTNSGWLSASQCLFVVKNFCALAAAALLGVSVLRFLVA